MLWALPVLETICKTADCISSQGIYKYTASSFFCIQSFKKSNSSQKHTLSVALYFQTTRSGHVSTKMDTKVGSINVVASPNADVGCLPSHGVVSSVQTSTVPISFSEATLGRHLARRLVQIGVSDVFSVPGDFNLTLLDHLITEPGLNLVGCCNELNAGYAADGYARSRGVGACVVTFTVGGLSVINAIAGAYSENLPVICIVGGPNSNDYGTNRILHHTIGLPDFSQEHRCFQTITCFQVLT